MPNKRQLFILALICFLVFLPLVASAAPVNTGGILNDTVQKFQTAASQWSATLVPFAKHLFLGLAVIGLIWTSGFLVLERADIGAFFATFIRWMLFVGFFWWILLNGTAIAGAIVESFAKIGGQAAGIGQNNLGPSTPLSIAFNILKASGNAGHWYQVGDQICMVLVLLVILLALATIAANMLVTLCTAWLLIYAGTILLAFGAVKWTSDIAISYLRHVLGIGVTYMTMLLLVGVANSVMQDMLNGMANNTITWEGLAVIAVVAVVLAFLVHKVPPLVGSITGNNGGAHGSLGMGAAIGAMAVAGAAIATGGAAIAGAMGGGGGGGGALGPLMNAVRGGSEASGGMSGGDGASMADGFGAANDTDAGAGGSLAEAMGEPSSPRSSSAGSVASGARSFGRVVSAAAHASVSAMDSAVGGSGYNGALAPGAGGGQASSSTQSAQTPNTDGGSITPPDSNASAPADDTPPSSPPPTSPSADSTTPPSSSAGDAAKRAFQAWQRSTSIPDAAAEVAAFVKNQQPPV